MAMRKTAITVPEEILAEVDRAARRRGESRSRFISRVLSAAVRARRDAEVTRRLDELFADPAVAAITSNLRLAAMPGNVRLRRGEAGLTRPSVVNLSQLRTVDRSVLVGPRGAIGPARLADVRRGLALVLGIDRLHGVASER